MKMDLIKGKTYILIISINGKSLTYTAKIISSDIDSVTFIDKYNDKFTYNKNTISGFKELEEWK